MSDVQPHEQLRSDRAVEWGTYVATEAIFVAGARAFSEGDPVPVSHVERGVVNADQVRKVSSSKPAAPAGKG